MVMESSSVSVRACPAPLMEKVSTSAATRSGCETLVAVMERLSAVNFAEESSVAALRSRVPEPTAMSTETVTVPVELMRTV